MKEKSLQIDSKQKYILQLPIHYNPENKYPLFIAIHWLNGTARQQINEWRFLANKNKYILLCPQFNLSRFNSSLLAAIPLKKFGFDTPQLAAGRFIEGYQQLRRNEAAKLVEIISEVEKEFSINREKNFLVGFSGGAQFTHRFVYRYPFVKAVCILATREYDPPLSSLAVKKVKYFVGVGEDDERYKKMVEFYNLLKRKDYDVTFESFPLVGHNLHSGIKDGVMNFLNSIE